MKSEDCRKKSYTFRFSQKISNDLSKLAAGFHLDRTAMLEYMIVAWANMWIENKDEEKVLDSSEDSGA